MSTELNIYVLFTLLFIVIAINFLLHGLVFVAIGSLLLSVFFTLLTYFERSRLSLFCYKKIIYLTNKI